MAYCKMDITMKSKECVPDRGKLYILITIVITLCLLQACSSASTDDPAAPQPAKPPIDEPIAKADRLYLEREDPANLREAVRITGQVRDPSNRNFEVEWKFAKFSYFLGKQIDDEDEAEEVFEKGRDAGNIASRMEPEKPDGYFWYAANLGELAQRSPITVGIKSVGDIREAMEKVIALEPGYQGASAYDALAQLEMKARLTGGKAEKAVDYLEKALEIEKENSNIRLHLAEAYLAVKKPALAKKQLDLVLQMQPPRGFEIEHKAAVEDAKSLIRRNF